MEYIKCLQLSVDSSVVNLISAIWAGLSSLLNSAFLSALMGALAGALAAQRISERSKTKELLLTEMKVTNAAITVTFGIVNSILSYNDQFIKPLRVDFEAAEDLYKKTLVALKINPPTSSQVISLEQNFITLTYF